jgi:peptidoglycan/xylan/chitin deacetylase (PgdA/CDA1 family)
MKRETVLGAVDRLFNPYSSLAGLDRGVRILMYHLVAKEPMREESQLLTVSVDRFREQLGLIRSLGIKVVSLQEALSVLGRNGETGRCAVITFDDFFSETVEYAAPVLEEFKFPACFFVVTDYLDRRDKFAWLQNSGQYPSAGTREMVRELARKGFEIGSHTCSHPRLNSLTPPQLDHELRDSRKALEDICGKQVEFFAYPYGDVSTTSVTIRQAIKESGYAAGLGTLVGTNQDLKDPYFMFRTYVVESDRGGQFARKLKGGHDWFRAWQRFQYRNLGKE